MTAEKITSWDPEADKYWPEYRDRPAVIYDCPPELLFEWNNGVPPADGEYRDVFVVGLGRSWIRESVTK